MGSHTPIIDAWRARLRNRIRADGLWAWAIPGLGAVVALGLAVPVVDAVFFGWVDGPASVRTPAYEGLLDRSALLLVGWVALDAYGALVRDGDREVLAWWPVEPYAVVRFEILRLALRKMGLVVALGVLFTPLLRIGPVPWALACLHAATLLPLALAAGALGTLGAVEWAVSPRARPWLDRLRGSNHPLQAAFIYAPAVVLLFAGGVGLGSAWGAGRVVAGQPGGWVPLLLPLPLAVLVWAAVVPLARRTWFQAGVLVAEIDARYAQLEGEEERSAVYLDWIVRYLPRRVGMYALRDLRHGWRQRRGWISAGWLLGLGCLASGWSADPAARTRTLVAVVAACWVVAAASFRLHADEPAFLRSWLPPDERPQTVARAVVLMVWMAPIVGLGVVATAFWGGVPAAARVVFVGGGAGLGAAIAASWLSRRRGLWLYAPLGALAVLTVAGGMWS